MRKLRITDFDLCKPLHVTADLNENRVRYAPRVPIVHGDPATSGTGRIVLNWNHMIYQQADIAVYDAHNQLMTYIVEEFNLPAKFAIILIDGVWMNESDVIQAKLAYGNNKSGIDGSNTVCVLISEESERHE